MPIQLDLSDSELLSGPIQAAHEDGRKAGARQMFQRAVAQRFGESTADLTPHIDSLDSDAISRLTLQALKARSVEDLMERITEVSGQPS